MIWNSAPEGREEAWRQTYDKQRSSHDIADLELFEALRAVTGDQPPVEKPSVCDDRCRELMHRVEMRTRQLSTLLQIASGMTLTLELGSLLDLILDGLQLLVEYDGAIIYGLQGEEMVALSDRGVHSSLVPCPSSVPMLESALAQRLVTERRSLVLSSIEGQPTDRLLAAVSEWACCAMAAPLIVRDRVVGLLLLYSSSPRFYTDQHSALLLALANQAAVCIENARLYEQAQALAVLEERQRLARDLHDSVSQALFSANAMTEALPRLWDRDPEAVRRYLPQLHRLTSGALAEMRSLLLELRPAALAEMELGELLRQAVVAFSGKSRTRASLKLVGSRPLPMAVQFTLYRIAQEALNNVAKHSRAAEVEVCLQMESDTVKLAVCDDGRGFDPARLPPGCMGLSILRERARAIGATLDICSRPGEGTEIVVSWTEPL